MSTSWFRYPDGVAPNVAALGVVLLGWPLGVALLTADAWALNALGFGLVVTTLVWSAYFIHEFAHQAIFRTADDRVFALLDRCPHKGGPLSQGIVFGDGVACPLHNWTIGLDSGCAKAPDEGCTPRFSVKVDDGVVHLDARELASHATDLTRPVAGPARRELSPLPLGEG